MIRPLLSVVIPYQSPTGLSLSQLALFFQFGPPMELYKAIIAALSEAAVPVGVGVAVAPGVAAPQSGRLSSARSFSAISRNPSGMHPVNWLGAKARYIRLDR